MDGKFFSLFFKILRPDATKQQFQTVQNYVQIINAGIKSS